jgi:hypothetical protein
MLLDDRMNACARLSAVQRIASTAGKVSRIVFGFWAIPIEQKLTIVLQCFCAVARLYVHCHGDIVRYIMLIEVANESALVLCRASRLQTTHK